MFIKTLLNTGVQHFLLNDKNIPRKWIPDAECRTRWKHFIRTLETIT